MLDVSNKEECGDWTQTYNSTTCSTVEFRCNDGNCIGHDLLCNGVADCPDSSDEDYWMCRHSEHNTTTAAPATCDPIQFRCEEGSSPQCILGAFVCDKEKDCKNGEDEKDCPEGGMCQGEMFPCLFSAGCLSNDQLCDGHKDCIDGSDEVFCDKVNFTAPTCPTGQTQCVDGSECIDVFRWCDGHIDCLDSSDEDSEKCKGLESQSIHVGYIQVDRKSVTNSSFLLLWEPPSNRHGFDITYKPSIRLQGGEWMNYTNQRGNSFRFRNLLPNTQYEASVSVNATHAGHSHLHALYEPYSNVLTSDGCPTAPLNVTVSQPEGIDNTVRVVWKEPLSPNGLISTYKVYYTPPVPEMVETSGVNRMVTYMYVKNLKSTETYTFQVAAVNEAHTVSGIACVGPRSEAVKFRFQEAPISQVTGAKEEVGMTTSTSVSLIWDAVKVPVKGYKVIYVQDGIIDIVMTTTQTKLTVDGLSPGIKYVFKVYAYRDEGHFQEAGPETFVEVTTKGKSLKAPRQLVANTVNATSVELMWKAPANDTTAWTYGISYGVNEHRLLLRGERARTSATSIVLKHLVSCEDYIFKVRVVGPTGKGPFSNAALSRTEFDVLSHPKKLAWEHLTNVTSVNVTWLASCDIVKKPLGYVVRIADKQDPSKPSSFTLPQTTAAFNNFTLVNLIRGATYAVTMKTNVLGARWTNPLEIDIASYPAPTEVKAVLTLGGVLELSWRAPAEMPAGMGYAIWVAEGDGNLTHRYTAPPGNEFDFPATMQLGRFYRFAVSVDRVSGHYGQLSRTYEADIHPHGYAGGEDAHESSMLYRVVLPSLGVVIALLVVGMVIFWMKHRRLRRSFLAFANSHYDTRSGTTTFSTDLGGDDEEDSPMIRGFADDEPLVIA
ncbi:PREDICTED: sortilin-related receptor-like isoform X2 [Priapulus caudatus]|uniref:Sortilin-related receptor-like isoform X2 n=1 Tax=Priapulus caudatus TaxID=37621 RepID=A0ABM1ECL8_PRICU|nr:PREDICTED: sortilin-related receptor-like isoform X2 [Priapulus caudatus]